MGNNRDVKPQAGFTVIETLIVLAIASLILTLMLLAIPALQRSSRNNQRNQDVQTVLAAVSQYMLNNSGNLPAACGDIIDLGQQSCSVASSNVSAPNDYFLRFVANKLTYYKDPGQVKLAPLTSGATGRYVTDLDGVAVFNYQRCTNDGKSTPQGAGYSDVVALYAIETRTSTTPKCQQL